MVDDFLSPGCGISGAIHSTSLFIGSHRQRIISVQTSRKLTHTRHAFLIWHIMGGVIYVRVYACVKVCHPFSSTRPYSMWLEKHSFRLYHDKRIERIPSSPFRPPPTTTLCAIENYSPHYTKPKVGYGKSVASLSWHDETTVFIARIYFISAISSAFESFPLKAAPIYRDDRTCRVAGLSGAIIVFLVVVFCVGAMGFAK